MTTKPQATTVSSIPPPAFNGPPEATKKAKKPPSEMRNLRLIAALLEQLDVPARLRICHYLSSYYMGLDAEHAKRVQT